MMNFRPHGLAAALLLGAATAVAATHSPPPAPAVSPASAVAVKIDNFTFNAASITIRPGTTVTWTNRDDIPHTVVAKDRSFRSAVLDTGDAFSFTFTRAGAYDYFCSIHPHMTGHVIVRA